MRKWEYAMQSRRFPKGNPEEGVHKQEVEWLDYLGNRGWELVSVIRGLAVGNRYYFKRAIE
jgi:hypothetical protein